VRAVPPPRTSRLAPSYHGADLVDAYAVALAPGGARDLGVLATRVLDDPPSWLRAAMRLRDAAVGPFGIATSGAIRARLVHEGADRIGFFPVLSRHAAEIVLGLDDSHLDFRASLVLREGAEGGDELVAITVVRCRNGLGRAYLAAVSVGHRLVVRSGLARAAV
jgi:hypothetical protein